MDEYEGFWIQGKGSGIEGWYGHRKRFGNGCGDGFVDGNGDGYGSGNGWGDGYGNWDGGGGSRSVKDHREG